MVRASSMLRRVVASLGGAALVISSAGAAADAAAPAPPTLQLTTDYPTVAAQAGDTIEFELEVTADRRDEIELDVVDAPPEWQLTLRGGGFVIREVTADPESPPRVELEVAIPPSTPPGEYEIGLRALGGAGTDDLQLTVMVDDRPVGGVQLATDFASLRGKPSDTFRYDLDVTNHTPEEITFAFDGRGPEGWSVTAGPASEQRASTVTVAPGETESVKVEADPPGNTPAGTYDIVVTASGGGQSGSFTLQAEVTGQANLELLSSSGRLDLTGSAGEEVTSTIVVVNSGSAPLEAVSLRADEPSDWTVSFAPEEIDAIPAGQSREVEVTVQPTSKAVAGDYAIGLVATAGGERDELAYRFTVETSRWWGAIGVVIIAAAFVLLFGVFRRFGRR